MDIFLDGEKAGKITASFQVKSDRISGTIVTGSEETAKQIEEHLQELQDAMQEPADIHVAYTPDLSLSQFEMSGIRRESEMKEQGELEEDRSNQVQTTRLYHTAEVFINSIKSLLTKTKICSRIVRKPDYRWFHDKNENIQDLEGEWRMKKKIVAMILVLACVTGIYAPENAWKHR